MGRLTHRRVVHAQVVADRTHDDLARVHADADVQRQAARAPELLGVAPELLPHAQCGEAGAHGVVLAGQRRAEQRHDAVSHHLVDGAIVTVHCLHHALEHRIQQFPRLFRVAVREQFHGPFHVGKQDGYLLALPLDAALGGQNPFGQVLGRISVAPSRVEASSRAPHALQKRAPAGFGSWQR